MIAALYVESGGAYFGLPGVDPWDQARDARKYAGPHPVVAHPPCHRWSVLAYVNEKMHGYRVGDDGGCFAAALASVRKWGGVLEHPAGTAAWAAFGLAKPIGGAWASTICGGWVTEVAQRNYGHPATKKTWLYYVGRPPAALDWSAPAAPIAKCCAGHRQRSKDGGPPRLKGKTAIATPAAFREVLLSLARSAGPVGFINTYISQRGSSER